jgi:ketosteroid isomerase-like protein
MLETAPAVIERFMEAAARRDYEIIAECFSEDATVEDEARTHRGRRQIEE